MKRKKAVRSVGSCLMGGFIALSLITQMGCIPVEAPAPGVPEPPNGVPVRAEQPSREPLPELIVTEIEEEKEAERLYSFTLRDADIREVVLAISKQTSFNIVLDPGVQGSVTVDLKNVTLAEALDTLTDLLAITYKVKRNLIRITKPELETRVFSLQYVNLTRTGTSSTSAQIGAAVGGGGSGSAAVTTTTNTDLWTDVETGVKSLLSPAGKLIVDKQSGNIVVTDLPKYLAGVASFLESIEGSVQRQVFIEARIVEVILTGDYRFGLDWSAIARAGTLKGDSLTSVGNIFSQQLGGDATDFQVGVTGTDFTALLDVLSRQGEVNVLSSPKLATLNNQTAVIRSATDDVFFITEVERVASPTGTGTEEVRTVTPQTVTIGVVLSVTPQISSDGTVILHIRPTVTEKSGEAISSDGDTFPILDVREADVIVRAREGQVVVIGGLMQERKSDDERKVPILGDLPGIGRFFRSTVQERKNSELVVLLRPTVLVGKKVDEVAARELERLEKSRGSSPW